MSLGYSRMTEPVPPRAREKADCGTAALNLPPDGTLEQPLFLKRSGRGTTAGLCSYPCLTPPGPCCPNSPRAGPQQRSRRCSWRESSFSSLQNDLLPYCLPCDGAGNGSYFCWPSETPKLVLPLAMSGSPFPLSIRGWRKGRLTSGHLPARE